MTVHNIVAKTLGLSLLLLFTVCGQAQVTLPVPDKNASELIAVLTSDGPDFEKAKACQQLAIVGDAAAVPALASLLSNDHLSTYARSALETLATPEASQALVKACEILQGNQLLGAIQSLGKRRDPASLPILIKMLDADDPQIQIAAARALGQLGTVAAAEKLLLTLQRAPVESRDAMAKACLICSQRLLDSGKNEKAEVLCREIVSAAKSNVDAVQDAATRLLGEWLTADAAPQMFELAKSLPSGKYRTRVLRGYIRIARQLDMSLDQRMEVCRNALAIADRTDEKLLVLAVLRRHRSPEGIAMAKSLVKEPGLKQQAQVTIAQITDDVGQDNDETGFVSLFDGKTLDGWKEHTVGFWRVENGAIVGGDLESKVKQNEFLRSRKMYGDFELRLQFKLIGEKTNAGVQFRTEEIPDDHEVSGYQADLGDGWWGCLYDESRRRKVLAGPPADERAKPVRVNEWNDYRIRCQGKRIQLWINDIQTVDYTEPDPEIPQTGIIALQVHGNLINEAHYRNIRIKELR